MFDYVTLAEMDNSLPDRELDDNREVIGIDGDKIGKMGIGCGQVLTLDWPSWGVPGMVEAMTRLAQAWPGPVVIVSAGWA